MYNRTIIRWIPEIIVLIVFCLILIYLDISVNHPLEGAWYCEETDQYIQINSYFDEGGDHMTVSGYIWNYDYNIFSKELTIFGYERVNYSSFEFTLKLKAEVIDDKLYLNFIESSDSIVRFDNLVCTRVNYDF